LSPLVYFISDLYPWWGIPLALIFAEVANSYRRRGERKKMMIHLSVSLVFFALAVAYFAFNGVERLRPAMEELEQTYLSR
jgi:hypothetical protein